MKKKIPERIKLGPTIDKKIKSLIDTMWDKPNTGATYLLDSWPALYNLTLKELKGRFSKGELMLFIDVMNGTMLRPGLAGQHLHSNVVDGVDLDKLDEKWEIDNLSLMEKMNNCTYFQFACIELWCQAFWHRCDDLDIDEYVTRLL